MDRGSETSSMKLWVVATMQPTTRPHASIIRLSSEG